MFNIGDLIIYVAHGICIIDDICEKTYMGITQNYDVLHPLEDCKFKISTPVDNDKVTMLELIDKEEAKVIMESFLQPGISWVEIMSHPTQLYSEVVKQGNRKEIAKVVNTLMRKKYRAESNGRKFHKTDNDLLSYVQNILFAELAMSFNTTFEEINDKVMSLLAISENN